MASQGRGGQPQVPKIVIPEGVSEYYANAVQVAWTPWDFTLMFGSNVLSNIMPGQGLAAIREIRIDALIKMSPQHAKATVDVLRKLVDQYEAQVGTINMPPEQT